MAVKNAYPEKPIVPYRKTSVPMQDVINYIHSLPVELEVKRTTYIFFRNESTNGQKGINNNYAGIQTDGARWPAKFDEKIIGTVVLKENQTGKERRFAAFRDFRASVDFLADRVKARGLYVGGTTHKILTMKVGDADALARAYYKEWVRGSATAEPTPEAKRNFLSMYRQATLHFV
jgi:hypothetical protein